MCSTKLSFKRDIYRYLITQNYGRVYSVLKNLQNRNTVAFSLYNINKGWAKWFSTKEKFWDILKSEHRDELFSPWFIDCLNIIELSSLTWSKVLQQFTMAPTGWVSCRESFSSFSSTSLAGTSSCSTHVCMIICVSDFKTLNFLFT